MNVLKNELEFPFNRMPIWLLWVTFYLVAFPLHIAVGLWGGLKDGFDNFKLEREMLLEE